MSEETAYRQGMEPGEAVPLGEWGHFEELPDPIPADPADEDGYCRWCGNGTWKHHAPPCVWADARDAAMRGNAEGGES